MERPAWLDEAFQGMHARLQERLGGGGDKKQHVWVVFSSHLGRCRHAAASRGGTPRGETLRFEKIRGPPLSQVRFDPFSQLG